MQKRHVPLILGGILAIFLIVSVVLFITVGNRIVGRVVFYPNERTLELEGELRRIPHRGNREEDLYLLIREILLGPAEISHTHIAPRSTKIRTVIYRGRVLYADFSTDIIFEDRQRPVPFDLTMEGIRKTIMFNYPGIESIIITIGGVPIAENRG